MYNSNNRLENNIIFSSSYIEDCKIDAWFYDNDDRDILEISLEGHTISFKELDAMYGLIARDTVDNMAIDAI